FPTVRHSLSPRGTSGERGRFCGFDVVWRPLSLTLSPLLRPGEREPRSPYPGRNDVDGARTGDSSPSPWGEGWGEGNRSARLPMAYPLEPSSKQVRVSSRSSPTISRIRSGDVD